MRVDGKAYQVSDDAPVGYAVKAGGKPRRCRCRSARPAADERPRGHRRHRHGGPVGDHPRPQRPLALRAAARARRRARAHRRRRRPPGRRARRARLPRARGRRPDPHHRRARADRRRPHGRGRGRVRGPGDGARPGARGADPRDPAPQPRPLALLQRGGDAGREPQAGDRPARRDDPRAGRDRARPRRPRADGRPLVVVLPGPPGELRPMWAAAVDDAAAARAARPRGHVRVSGCCASTACRRRRSRSRCSRSRRTGSRSTGSRSRPACAAARSRSPPSSTRPPSRRTTRSSTGSARATRDTLFSEDGATIDAIVAGLLSGRTIAVAESCTGGLMAGRLTDRAGSSAYVLGGVVAYSNAAKVAFADVPAELIERHGAVSPEVAAALADGAAARFGAERRRRHHGRRRARRRDAREAGRAGLPQRGARRAAGGSTAPCSSRATARWCASARRPS